MVFLDSDSEDKIEITTTNNSLGDRLIKCPRLTTEDKAILVRLGNDWRYRTIDNNRCQNRKVLI